MKTKAAGTEKYLLAAGFTSKHPNTPEAWNKFKSLKPLKMIKTKKDGQVIYVYPDPYNCKCVYVGDEKQYAEFMKLCLEKKIADENLQATEMWESGPPAPVPYDDWWW
jgi:hypothetical protein